MKAKNKKISIVSVHWICTRPCVRKGSLNLNSPRQKTCRPFPHKNACWSLVKNGYLGSNTQKSIPKHDFSWNHVSVSWLWKTSNSFNLKEDSNKAKKHKRYRCKDLVRKKAIHLLDKSFFTCLALSSEGQIWSCTFFHRRNSGSVGIYGKRGIKTNVTFSEGSPPELCVIVPIDKRGWACENISIFCVSIFHFLYILSFHLLCFQILFFVYSIFCIFCILYILYFVFVLFVSPYLHLCTVHIQKGKSDRAGHCWVKLSI